MPLIDRLKALADRLATGNRLPDAAGAEAVVLEAIAVLAYQQNPWQPIEAYDADRDGMYVLLGAHFIGAEWLIGAAWSWTYHAKPTHWMHLTFPSSAPRGGGDTRPLPTDQDKEQP